MTSTPVSDAACPVCRSAQANEYHADATVRLVRCGDCGLKYQNPFPTMEALSALYASQDYYDGQYFPAQFAERKAMFAHRLAALEKLTGGPGRVLEVGCGRGQFLEAAIERGWKASGQEFAEGTVEVLKKIVPLAELAFGVFPRECPFPAGSFDLVHLNHVLEHFFDPMEALRRVWELLKPGGVLYCEVPRQSSLQTTLSNLIGRKDFAVHFFLEHICYFDRRSMTRALESSGFTPLSIRIEGMGDPHRFVRGVHYTSAWTHLLALVVGGLKLQGPLGGGNLVAIARKEGSQ
ncbi:class I SAM-dependent methyltransferase [Fundidesulfovibrio terrae]|uniref:class I SAM-dependent methyltransferase n=1 Tax=Fundidesulfovibrio terrae TaxID=2922866 RepID=UPI001FAF0361|nr:class I SAM-dependent methyltransferase [Fundidesulfovibrio terrae]